MKFKLTFCFLLIFIFLVSCKLKTKEVINVGNDDIKDVLVEEGEIFIFLKDKVLLKFNFSSFLDSESEYYFSRDTLKVHEYDSSYGNFVDWNFIYKDSTLFLKNLKAFFPFKQDILGRNKYCIMDSLNMDIRTIDSEQLFEEFNTEKYCELRK
ncbi:hypothetical protein KO500_13655 [Cellulophaga baltica]|uniref:hypothetical protein n=1 Tax=Cellulophaga TaxID=104264 RepID=UPI001C078F8A|nr:MULTISPECIES: hypothetical protein [Cellulophaga]MBU2997489.1 hypothetical protein [Cellulophaga baltica]MDO6768885.1 hypothetical protein [Cellulophaga sp. 1_MG-2023]